MVRVELGIHHLDCLENQWSNTAPYSLQALQTIFFSLRFCSVSRFLASR